MSKKIKIDDQEYELDQLTDKAKSTIKALKFVTERIKELDNMRILLRRAKNSYVSGIKKEMISNKAGLFLEDE
tara:strand:- start:227 stop:445 length:219 start_codon:yes stop_codon:yes gene_type:complete